MQLPNMPDQKPAGGATIERSISMLSLLVATLVVALCGTQVWHFTYEPMVGYFYDQWGDDGLAQLAAGGFSLLCLGTLWSICRAFAWIGLMLLAQWALLRLPALGLF